MADTASDSEGTAVIKTKQKKGFFSWNLQSMKNRL